MLSAAELERREDFASFLERDLQKDLLRFTTAGSVDDGKSTLIGRLLHDSRSVYEDQLVSIQRSRINRSGRAIDFSLLTDGLRAEREQGITIDVAYRYFSTPRRKFIIADTPGHEQYTRNMATGASTADLAVILVDASKGLLPQTRRHAYISALLGIPNVVAAINKMDLLDYREDVFLRLAQDFRELADSLGIASLQAIPISALEGDNVVTRSVHTPWYAGPTLMEHLETVDIRSAREFAHLRFPIQSVIRPDSTFRGFAGRVASGTIRPGDPVLALPSRQRTSVRSIVTYDGNLGMAVPQQSVVLQLEDEIDLSRGDMLAAPDAPPLASSLFTAMVVWLHAQPLQLDRDYLLKHSGRLLKARAKRIRFRVNINDLAEHPSNQLERNEIACVEFAASSPLFFDPYERNRTTGSLVLIDPLSNATVGAAMLREAIAAPQVQAPRALRSSTELREGPVAPQERWNRHGHRPAVFSIGDQPGLAELLESALFAAGFEVLLLNAKQLHPSASLSFLSALWSAGFVVVYSGEAPSPQERAALQALAKDRFFDLSPLQDRATNDEILRRALRLVESLRIDPDSQAQGASHD